MPDLTRGRHHFARILLQWNREKNTRQMPWKGEKDPYRIWLSEIILQQTRVEQGLDYYKRFVRAFPDVHQLAGSPDHKVLKLWEGLGYYTRCRNLLATARYISNNLKGQFPGTYEEIRSLKGIGPYTAAAIASFAYNLPHAVVDGNVFRVLSRVFGIDDPVDSTTGRKKFAALAQQLLDKKNPGLYNQAIMDFGATVCKPAAPLCTSCPFRKTCQALLNDSVDTLPVKEKKIRIRKRWFNYLVLESGNMIAVRQRKEKDIWQDLYEFPLVETKKEQPPQEILKTAVKKGWLRKNASTPAMLSATFRQQLSHQLITGRFITIRPQQLAARPGDWIWVSKAKMKSLAFPRLIRSYLENEEGGTAL